jgi:hypothetical protein
LFGLFKPYLNAAGFLRRIGQIWLFVGISGLIFRSVQLFFIRDMQTGLAWATKILTDPFNDIKLYYRAPIQLMHGEMTDEMALDCHG